MSSLTVQLVTQAEVAALRVLVMRLVTDAIMRCPDPGRALRKLQDAVDELGGGADYDRETALLASSKRAVTASQALERLVDEIGQDVREELRQREAA